MGRPIPRPRKRTGQVPVQLAPTMIRGYTPNRVSLLVVNAGSAIIYLGTDEGVNGVTGYPLLAGNYVVMDDTDPLFAVTATVNTILGWMEEVNP